MDESSGRLPTNTVTFLFSDIKGSTRLVQELDPPSYRQLLEQHHRLLRAASRPTAVSSATQAMGF